MISINQKAFIRDATVATVVLAGLYGLAYSAPFAPLQIPGYLLVGLFGSTGLAEGPDALFPVIFGSYLIFLGMSGAFVIHALRRQMSGDHPSSWRIGVASALGLVGIVSILLAIMTLYSFGTSQPRAVFTTGVSGVILIGLATWLAKLFTVSVRSS